jgi:hypothetical protein
MLTSDTWETMAEIHNRTGLRGEIVAAKVKEEFRSGVAVCRFEEDPNGYGGIIEFRRKQPRQSDDCHASQ